MPELPEVEVVRRGVQAHVVGRRVAAIEVRHPRAVRRHLAGASDLSARLAGRQALAARRRGKFLWLELDGPREVLVAHLGMSGQLLVQPGSIADETHLRVRLSFLDAGPQLRFVDQRTFGGLWLDPLSDAGLPASVAHIGPDPLDPAYDVATAVRRLRARRTGIKRALLDQGVVSGIGNIYADESLWRARVHGERATDTMSARTVRRVLACAAEVLTEALAQGGTSFDALYVDVSGASGYFGRSLAAYGRAGQPCPRCGTAIRREAFMNRSSFSCPRCQPAARRLLAPGR